MSDTLAGQSGFSIGRVASMTFGVIGRNLVPFVALSVISVLPLEIMSQYFLLTMQTGGKVDPSKLGSASYWLVLLVNELLVIVLTFLLQAALVHGTIVDLNGKRVSIGEAVTTSIRAFWPLIGLAIVTSLGVAGGFILFIVPGVMLLMAWFVAVPALVVERKSIFESLSRSGELTSGYRWPIFGIVVVFTIGVLIIQMSLKPLMGLSILATASPAFNPLAIFFDLSVRAATSVIETVGVACIYYQLRTAKEGIGPQQLASVFD
jgi:hypothetical protein